MKRNRSGGGDGSNHRDHRDHRVAAMLSEEVSQRFERITGLAVIAAPLRLSGRTSEKLSTPIPIHPLCRERAGTEECRRAWKAHFLQLLQRPEVHWHKCAFGNWCAVVPVVRNGQCLAMCRLVCPGTMDREAFEHHVELLDLLVDSFVSNHAEALDDDGFERTGAGGAMATVDVPDSAVFDRVSHPRVRMAIEHIERHIADPGLTVAEVAHRLGVNSTYLAHLFSKEVGMRMSRYIAARRIELAKVLLASTRWQIKRVAYESGHRNADWFSEVFHEHTGVTPSAYRRAAQA